MRSKAVLGVLALAILGPVLALAEEPKEPAAPRSSCPGALVSELAFPTVVAIDQVNVELSGPQPTRPAPRSVTRVEITTGRATRVLHASTDGARALRFSPALRGSHFRVALSTDKNVPVATCSARVALRQGSVEIAAIGP